jgi:hypothetical protein
VAVIGVHKTQAVLPGFWKVLLKTCSNIQLIGWQGEDIVVYRVKSDELPESDYMCTLFVTGQEGIEPFVYKIESTETLWQQSVT